MEGSPKQQGRACWVPVHPAARRPRPAALVQGLKPGGEALPAAGGWKRAAELTEDQRAGREAAVQSPYVCRLALLEKRNRGSAEGVTAIPTEAEVMLFPAGQVCQEKLPFALPERGEEE